MRLSIIAALAAVGILGSFTSLSWAEEESQNPAALANALAGASFPLEQGLTASAREGNPISGKYEIEDGALQLSVYTDKAGQFSEVIVDHRSGAIKKAEKITDEDDLKDAKEQSAAMAKAKVPLETAVASALKANGGYRAVSAVPVLSGGQPVADITLMKGENVKKVVEKLD